MLLGSFKTHAVLVATLEGHDNDILADGRNLHVIVAGYGGEMGNLTYEMAVSKAQKMKRDFPNERVVIIGSTPQKESATSRFSPAELERKYNIRLGYRSQNSFINFVNDQRPLTGEYLAGTVMNLLTHPNERRNFQENNPNLPQNVSTLRRAVTEGKVSLGGKIASMDFMTHSTPLEGIFLHDVNGYYHPVNNQNPLVSRELTQRGLGVDEKGSLVVTDRNRAMGLLQKAGLSLNESNQIVDIKGKPSSINFSTEYEGQNKKFSVDTSGNVFEIKGLPNGSKSRMLQANSDNFHYLNGLFTPDAYVNMSGCTSGYGFSEDMSKVLGVPVNGAATGSLVEVMDKNGDFYYNYPASNPYGDGELSESKTNGSKDHPLSPGRGRSVVGLKVDQRLYHGYWGILKSGTNFVTTSCQIRPTEPAASEDRQRCEMGMARSMEDALTATNVNLRATDLSFDDFTNVLIERMCPGGFSERGYISESQREVTELQGLKEKCIKAVRSLSYMNTYCTDNNPQFIHRLFQGEVSSSIPECRQEGQFFVDHHRFFVPLMDRLGKTLFCSLEKGCDVELKGCEVTPQEENQCLSVNSDKESQEFKSCMVTKRCQIDESKTRASNDNNPTFMKFIQHYMDGYKHLKNYRAGHLNFTTRPAGPQVTEETERLKNRLSSGYSSQNTSEFIEAAY